MTKRWVRVTCVESVPLREGREVLVGKRSLAVFNLGHKFLAIDNHCPHRQGPLADGIVSGNAVVCPLHAWRVNLESGAVEKPAAGVGHCVRAYATRVEDGVISVELPVPARPAIKDDSGHHKLEPVTSGEVA
jgi:nitrite reductase (NADH) small subunit